MIASDTSIAAAAQQYKILQGLDINARAKMTFDLSNNVRKTVETGVLHRHPEYNEDQVRRTVLRLMIGRQLFRKVFGKDKDMI